MNDLAMAIAKIVKQSRLPHADKQLALIAVIKAIGNE
jgi:hypothetical protein